MRGWRDESCLLLEIRKRNLLYSSKCVHDKILYGHSCFCPSSLAMRTASRPEIFRKQTWIPRIRNVRKKKKICKSQEARPANPPPPERTMEKGVSGYEGLKGVVIRLPEGRWVYSHKLLLDDTRWSVIITSLLVIIGRDHIGPLINRIHPISTPRSAAYCI